VLFRSVSNNIQEEIIAKNKGRIKEIED
jgi:hypothetical protein